MCTYRLLLDTYTRTYSCTVHIIPGVIRKTKQVELPCAAVCALSIATTLYLPSFACACLISQECTIFNRWCIIRDNVCICVQIKDRKKHCFIIIVGLTPISINVNAVNNCTIHTLYSICINTYMQCICMEAALVYTLLYWWEF